MAAHAAGWAARQTDDDRLTIRITCPKATPVPTTSCPKPPDTKPRLPWLIAPGQALFIPRTPS